MEAGHMKEEMMKKLFSILLMMALLTGGASSARAGVGDGAARTAVGTKIKAPANRTMSMRVSTDISYSVLVFWQPAPRLYQGQA